MDEVLKRAHYDAIQEAADQHGLDLGSTLDLSDCIKKWVRALHKEHDDTPAVVLIDEYDAPITAFLPHFPAGIAPAQTDVVNIPGLVVFQVDSDGDGVPDGDAGPEVIRPEGWRSP